MPRRSRPNGQYQPVTSTSGKDCMAAMGAHLVERSTVGVTRPSHTHLRTASGAPRTRGLTMLEVVRAIDKLYGIPISAHYGISRNALQALVASGKPVGVLIDTSKTRFTTRRTNFYSGPHAVYDNRYTFWPQGETCACEKEAAFGHGHYDIDDPGTTAAGFMLWSADLVYRAAESYGHGLIYCLAGPDTEGVERKAIKGGNVWSKPATNTTDPQSKRTRSIVTGRRYKVIRTLNGGTYKLASGRVTDGWVQTADDDYMKADRLERPT